MVTSVIERQKTETRRTVTTETEADHRPVGNSAGLDERSPLSVVDLIHHRAEEVTTTHRPATEAVAETDPVASPVDSRGVNRNVVLAADQPVIPVFTIAAQARNQATEAPTDAGAPNVRRAPEGG